MKVLLAATICLALSSCLFTQDKYFEGQIKYTIDVKYKGDNERHKQFYENERFGDTIVVSTNQAGFVRRDFPGSGIYGPEYYLYDPSENIQYAKFRFTDTIYWYVADTNLMVDPEILDQADPERFSYEGQELTQITTVGVDPVQDLSTSAKYWYLPRKYPINYPAWANNEDFLIGEVYGRAKSHFLRLYMDYGNYEYTMKAVNISEKTLDDDIFTVPENVPMKNQ